MNVERMNRLADVMEFVLEEHSGLYDQHTWGEGRECGTVACLAGWCAADAGMHPAIDEHGFSWELVAEEPFIDIDEGAVYISEWARERLGLAESEACFLFSPEWEPPAGYTIPEALLAYASGELEIINESERETP